jgi:hypothetical protein
VKIYVANQIVDRDNESFGYLVYEADLETMVENIRHNYTTFGKLIGHYKSLKEFAGKLVIQAGAVVVNTNYTLEDLKLDIEPHEFKE